MSEWSRERLEEIASRPELLVEESDRTKGFVFAALKDEGIELSAELKEASTASKFSPFKKTEAETKHDASSPEETERRIIEGLEPDYSARITKEILIRHQERIAELLETLNDSTGLYRAVIRTTKNMWKAEISALSDKLLSVAPNIISQNSDAMTDETLRKDFVRRVSQSAKEQGTKLTTRNFVGYEFKKSDEKLLRQIIKNDGWFGRNYEEMQERALGFENVISREDFFLEFAPDDVSSIEDAVFEGMIPKIREIWTKKANEKFSDGLSWLVRTKATKERFEKIVSPEMVKEIFDAQRWERHPEIDGISERKEKWNVVQRRKIERAIEKPNEMTANPEWGESVCAAAIDLLEHRADEFNKLLTAFYKGPFGKTFVSGPLMEAIHFGREPFFTDTKARPALAVVIGSHPCSNATLAAAIAFEKDKGWRASHFADERALILESLSSKTDSKGISTLRELFPGNALVFSSGGNKGAKSKNVLAGLAEGKYSILKDGELERFFQRRMSGFAKKFAKNFSVKSISALAESADEGDETALEVLKIIAHERQDEINQQEELRSALGDYHSGCALIASNGEQARVILEAARSGKNIEGTLADKEGAAQIAARESDWEVLHRMTDKDSRLTRIAHERIASMDILEIRDAVSSKDFISLVKSGYPRSSYGEKPSLFFKGVASDDAEETAKLLFDKMKKGKDSYGWRDGEALTKIIGMFPIEKRGFVKKMLVQDFPEMIFSTYGMRGGGKESCIGDAPWSGGELVEAFIAAEKKGASPMRRTDVNAHLWDCFERDVDSEEAWREAVNMARKKNRKDVEAILFTSSCLRSAFNRARDKEIAESFAKEANFENLAEGISKLATLAKESTETGKSCSEVIRAIFYSCYWDESNYGSDTKYFGLIDQEDAKKLIAAAFRANPSFLVEISSAGTNEELANVLEREFEEWLPNVRPRDLMFQNAHMDLPYDFTSSPWRTERGEKVLRGYVKALTQNGDKTALLETLHLIDRFSEEESSRGLTEENECCPFLELAAKSNDFRAMVKAGIEAADLKRMVGEQKSQKPSRRRI